MVDQDQRTMEAPEDELDRVVMFCEPVRDETCHNYEASHRWSDQVGGSSRAGLVTHSTGGTGL